MLVPPLPAKRYRLSLSVPIGGPGTELAKMLKWLGFNPTAECRCLYFAAEMDRAGPRWCTANIERILDWLAAEAARRRIIFLRTFARELVRLAIRRAVESAE